MTVTYTPDVASISRKYGGFWKLLFRWEGSMYKVIWKDLVIYLALYVALSLVYRLALDAPQREQFEAVSVFFNHYTDLIPVAFVLGFYVSLVVGRWWDQYQTLPWPDTLALYVSTCINGQDSRSRAMRRTVVRYANLTYVLTLQMISPQVKRRFPSLQQVQDIGLVNENERRILEMMDAKTLHSIYWMPLAWAGAIITRARRENAIRDDFSVKTILDEISKFRGACGSLTSYDWINIPLVYTQVVTLAVYSFFLSTLMGRQYLDPAKGLAGSSIDLYVPVFTILQFVFYMGWLKVAESLVNPFGEDDDDFEVNWLIDRNIQVAYLIVDEMHEEHPDLMHDKYWDDVFPRELPQGPGEARNRGFKGSTSEMEVGEEKEEEKEKPPTIAEEVEPAEDSVALTAVQTVSA